MIIALSFDKTDQRFDVDVVCLNFHVESFTIDDRWMGFVTNKKSVARLILKKISSKIIGNDRVMFYEGSYGEHRFIPLLQQLINRKKEQLSFRKPDNIDLPGNLHDQIRIAYSVPRTIPLISVSDGRFMNMFPTDLHGAISPKWYVSSLRKGGKATTQVETFGRLTLSNIDASQFSWVYSLGKNHMQDLKDRHFFECLPYDSETLSLPLPSPSISYKELVRCESFDIGIHRIHLYENVNEKKVKEGLTLAHIHQYYAQWRMDHAQETNMLLR